MSSETLKLVQELESNRDTKQEGGSLKGDSFSKFPASLKCCFIQITCKILAQFLWHRFWLLALRRIVQTFARPHSQLSVLDLVFSVC